MQIRAVGFLLDLLVSDDDAVEFFLVPSGVAFLVVSAS
jgi:hypothetical protein